MRRSPALPRNRFRRLGSEPQLTGPGVREHVEIVAQTSSSNSPRSLRCCATRGRHHRLRRLPRDTLAQDLVHEPESINARIRRAVNARGHFLTEQAALKRVYLALMSLDPTGAWQKRWSNRWKAALNAFEITLRRPPVRRPQVAARAPDGNGTPDLPRRRSLPAATRKGQDRTAPKGAARRRWGGIRAVRPRNQQQIIGAPGRIRTCDARLRSPNRRSFGAAGGCWPRPLQALYLLPRRHLADRWRTMVAGGRLRTSCGLAAD